MLSVVPYDVPIPVDVESLTGISVKQTAISVAVALAVSALYFHLIGPAVAEAMKSKPAAT